MVECSAFKLWIHSRMNGTPPYPNTPPYHGSPMRRQMTLGIPNNMSSISNINSNSLSNNGFNNLNRATPLSNTSYSTVHTFRTNNAPANNTMRNNNYNKMMEKGLMGAKVKKNRKTRKTRKIRRTRR